MSDEQRSSGGCGCLGFILTVLALWALAFGLPTSWGTVNIDLLPPGVYVVPR